MATSPNSSPLENDLLRLMLETTSLDPGAELHPDDLEIYPWDPSSPDAEAYFQQIEQYADQIGWSADELTPYAQALGQTLDQCWSEFATDSTDVAIDAALQATVSEQFSAYQLPKQLLSTIIQQAQQAVASNLSLADQLVQCVQDVLPDLAIDDLQVLVRPYAYAMRDTTALDAALRTVRYAAWTELSGVEQARLSLAIARYTLAQMPNSSKPSH